VYVLLVLRIPPSSTTALHGGVTDVTSLLQENDSEVKVVKQGRGRAHVRAREKVGMPLNRSSCRHCLFQVCEGVKVVKPVKRQESAHAFAEERPSTHRACVREREENASLLALFVCTQFIFGSNI
jgi:hypothetical protein